MGYFDYEQYDGTALAAIYQQRANALGAELIHGYQRPAEARGDQVAADAYLQEGLAVEKEYRRVWGRAESIAAMRRWDARLEELRTARAARED